MFYLLFLKNQQNLKLSYAANFQIVGGALWVNIFVNSSLAGADICHLLITLSNSLDPDQNQQNIGPDLNQNHLTF